jgi:hypothetical protein
MYRDQKRTEHWYSWLTFHKEALNLAAQTAEDIRRGTQFRMGTTQVKRGHAQLTVDHQKLELS